MEENTGFFKKKCFINCRGALLDLSGPMIMGILNLTPDSFYDGGKYKNEKDALNQTGKMLEEGAGIIDIGAVSSRPGAEKINPEEEQTRLLPHLRNIARKFPGAVLSVDTYNASTARAAVNEGAAIINDISGGTMDKEMFETIASLNVPYILMHIQGTPQSMQKKPIYEDVFKAVSAFFSERTDLLKRLGVNDIIIDPGFGFGKTVEHNYTLLNNLDKFRIFNLPVLAGLSRKSMICRVLDSKPEAALNGTTALNTIALLKGANILRVHDVKEAVEVMRIAAQMAGRREN